MKKLCSISLADIYLLEKFLVELQYHGDEFFWNRIQVH